MKRHQFDEKLRQLNITKKEFAKLTNISYHTVSNWNDTTKPIPKWVPSWLKYYERSKKLDELLNFIRIHKIL